MNKDCGCRIVILRDPKMFPKEITNEIANMHIEFCPLHAAAPQLLEAAKRLADIVEANWISGMNMNVLGEMNAVIAEAEKEE